MKKAILLCAVTAALALFLSACAGIHLTFDGLSDYTYDDADRYREATSETMTFDGIRTLDIGWLSGEVTVSFSGESDRVSVSEDRADYPLCYFVDGDTLRLQYCRSGLKPSELNKSLKGGKKLTVTVPAGLSALDVNTVSAGVTLTEGVTAAAAEINTVSGKVKIASGVSDRLEINTVSGNADVGAMRGENGGTLRFSSVSGDLTVSVSPSAGYLLKFESISGKVVNDSGTESRADGKLLLEVETVSGGVTLKSAR